MRHLKKGKKFGRVSKKRQALLKNLVSSLIKYEKIKTTLARAKEMKRITDKLIDRKNPATLAQRRDTAAQLPASIVKKLFADLAANSGQRGGHTRITHLDRRRSDGAPMAIIELWKALK